MAIQFTRCAARIARALVASALVLGGSWFDAATCRSQDFEEALSGHESITSAESLVEELPPGDEVLGPSNSEFLDPQSAEFDNEWRELSLYEDEQEEHIRPFDWARKWGFRHSSTEGRFHHEKSIPLHYSSWLNRPWHVDFFGGPLLTGDPDRGRVEQQNDMLLGLRFGYDFDYYWGAEWRLAWADPVVQLDSQPQPFEGDFFVTDVSLMYYPWGDTKVRPYVQAGMGATLVDSMFLDNHPQQATLLSTPFGMGVVVAPTRWLSFRLEVVDYLAWGSNGVDTMNNVLFAGGMEWRMGARPNSYWPWRSSRTIW